MREIKLIKSKLFLKLNIFQQQSKDLSNLVAI